MRDMAHANDRAPKDDVDTCAEEECWDLPADFDLYAKHEVGQVFYPTNKNNGCSDAPHHSFRIECIEPDTPLDINNQTQSSNEYDATGHCVWAGAFLLVQCIHELENFDIGNKRMIEFGCGTGIGGLAMILARNTSSAVPSHVCFSDNDPDALKVCKRNCELNDLSETCYTIKELTWGEDAVEDATNNTYDVALATDVLYDVDLIEPLFTSISRCIPSNGIFILSHIPRACYNEGNPPEAVEDLEKYIVDQAVKYSLRLIEIIRPPKEEEDFAKDLLDWCPATAFFGGGILIFRRT